MEGPKQEDGNAPPRTPGEVLFDNLTYYGIGWIGNALLSVWVSDQAENNPDSFLYKIRETAVNGAKGFTKDVLNVAANQELKQEFAERITDVFQNSGLTADDLDKAMSAIPDLQRSVEAAATDVGTNPDYVEMLYYLSKGHQFDNAEIVEALGGSFDAETFEKFSRDVKTEQISVASIGSLAGIIALCSGGFIILDPMKRLEDNKLAITKYLDENVVERIEEMKGTGPNTQEERDQRDAMKEARYEYIENTEVRQSYGSLIMSRIQSLLPIYALHVAWGSPNNVVKGLGSALSGQQANPDPNTGFGGYMKYMHDAGNATQNMLETALPEKAYQGLIDKLGGAGAGADKLNYLCTALATDMSYSFGVATLTYMFSRDHAKGSEQGNANIAPDDDRANSEKSSINTIDPDRQINTNAYERVPMQAQTQEAMIT